MRLIKKFSSSWIFLLMITLLSVNLFMNFNYNYLIGDLWGKSTNEQEEIVLSEYYPEKTEIYTFLSFNTFEGSKILFHDWSAFMMLQPLLYPQKFSIFYNGEPDEMLNYSLNEDLDYILIYHLEGIQQYNASAFLRINSDIHSEIYLLKNERFM